jgi:peptidoglycan/xylan/chitin deacetylase (PgdA/CDA1 family)
MKAIMYHYIREFDPKKKNLKFLHVDNFYKQLFFLKKNYQFLDKNVFLKNIKNKKNSNSIILTFDDGLIDHYQYVLPILKKLDLWGIFYIPTKCLKGSLLDVHKLHVILSKFEGREIYNICRNNTSFQKYLDSQHHNHNYYKTLSDDNYTKLIKNYFNYYSNVSHDQLSKLYKMLIKNDEVNNNFYVNKKQILEMHKKGMIIGAHTDNHTPLNMLPTNEQKNEIESSKKKLEKIIDDKILTFCFPHGWKKTVTDYSIKILKKKFDFSFVVDSRDITSKDLKKNVHLLPRFDCNEFKYGKCHIK